MRKILFPVSLVLFLSLTTVPSFANRPKVLDAVHALAWETADVNLDEDEQDAAGTPVMRNHCTTAAIDAKRSLSLTAAHCVIDEGGVTWNSDAFYLAFPIDVGMAYVPTTVVAVDLNADLAIVKTPGYNFATTLEMQVKPTTIGEDIMTAGYPMGWPGAMLFWGKVVDPDYAWDATFHRAIYQLTGAPGDSGSPVVNTHNEIVGVFQCGWAPFAAAHCGSPWNLTYAFVSRWLRDAK